MKPLGLVVCGGKSARMGKDKSQLVYHYLPQYAHLSNMLFPFCENVLISCNENQLHSMQTTISKMQDSAEFGSHGPIAAVLTAFQTFPDKDLLVIGCDYPFLDEKELGLFLGFVQRDALAAAFYNSQGKYEPMLAWYSKASARLLRSFFDRGEYALQHFLRQADALKYIPKSENSMISVDTPEDFARISHLLSQKN